MNHRSSVFAAAALAALTACTSTVDVPPNRPFAFLDANIVDAPGSPTQLAMKAQGLFTQARITGVIGSDMITERCGFPENIPTSLAYTTQPLDPGVVSLKLHGSVDTTTRTVGLRRLEQTLDNGEIATGWVNDQLPVVSPVTDTVIYTATGVAGGFPPFTVRAPTPALFTPQMVDDSATGAGLHIQWTASPNSSTAMQIALQYANDSSKDKGTIANREIVCIARDDGDFSINRSYLNEWEAAGVDSAGYRRQIVFSRFLTTTGTIADAIVTVVVRRDTTLVKNP